MLPVIMAFAMSWTATIDLKALLGELAERTPGRSEATVQSNVRTLLLAAPLNLEPGTVIKLEAQAGDRKRIDVEAPSTGATSSATLMPRVGARSRDSA